MPIPVQLLTDEEKDFLEDFIDGISHEDVMFFEEIDGFFCALIAGPDPVLPSEYLPQVWGGELVQGRDFDSIEELHEVLSLLERHWNNIAMSLARDEIYMPVLWTDEDGLIAGTDWAIGFATGMSLRQDAWRKLLEDDDHAGLLMPMMVLLHEDDPDPELRPGPLSAEQRENLLVGLAATPMLAYRYFRGLEEPPVRSRTKRCRRGRR